MGLLIQQHNGLAQSADSAWQQPAYIFALQFQDKCIDVPTMQPSSWNNKLYQDVDRLIAKARVSKPADTPGPCDASQSYPDSADNRTTVSDRDTLKARDTAHCALLGWTARAEQDFAWGNTQHKERMRVRALDADSESGALGGGKAGPGPMDVAECI